MLRMKLEVWERNFWAQTSDVQVFNFTYKTTINSIKTTPGMPRWHWNLWFYAGFIMFSFFENLLFLCFQVSQREAAGLIFMLCAKAYKNSTKLTCVVLNVSLGGMWHTKIIKNTQEFMAFLTLAHICSLGRFLGLAVKIVLPSLLSQV